MHIIVTLEALDTFIVSISIQLHNLLYAVYYAFRIASLREKMSIGENSFLSIHAISWGVQKENIPF